MASNRNRGRQLPPLPISRQDAQDLATLARQGADKLGHLARHLSTAESRPLTVQQLRREIERFVSPDVAEPVANQLVRLGFACRRRQRSAAAVVEALSKGLNNSQWFDAREEWKGVKNTVEELISAPSFHVLIKAIDLSYDYANLVDTLRIVVDMRPVMTEDREDIEACIISHVLRVEYVNDEGRHSLSLLLDDEDIESLRIACEEAFHKAKTVRKFMTANDKRVIQPGGDENERS